jgi:hypothetical protein
MENRQTRKAAACASCAGDLTVAFLGLPNMNDLPALPAD